MAVLAVVPSPAVTAAPLYVIEDHLAALVETAELVSPQQELEFRAEFQAALTAAVEKRDRVGQFLAHLEQQIDFAKFEIDRLRQRKATCERAFVRLENYVVETIENLGIDGKGKSLRSACVRVRPRWRLPTSQRSLWNTSFGTDRSGSQEKGTKAEPVV